MDDRPEDRLLVSAQDDSQPTLALRDHGRPNSVPRRIALGRPRMFWSQFPAPPDPLPDTPELRAFLEAVRCKPFEDGPQLRLADWLEERAGDYGRIRAELLRLQCAHFTALRETADGTSPANALALREVRKRLQTWERRHGRPIPCPFASSAPAPMRSVVELDIWSLAYGRWTIWSTVGDLNPVKLQVWLDAEPWRWVCEIRGRWVPDHVLARLANVPWLHGVRRIVLTDSFVGDAGLRALATSRHRHESLEVELSGTKIQPHLSEECSQMLHERLGGRFHILQPALV
jgi:uncharacterized protein (TIGR02996 family)